MRFKVEFQEVRCCRWSRIMGTASTVTITSKPNQRISIEGDFEYRDDEGVATMSGRKIEPTSIIKITATGGRHGSKG